MAESVWMQPQGGRRTGAFAFQHQDAPLAPQPVEPDPGITWRATHGDTFAALPAITNTPS